MQHCSKTLNLSPYSFLLSFCSLSSLASVVVQARRKSCSVLFSNFNELHSYLWMHVLNKLNVFPSFVRIYINFRCFVVGGANALHGLMFMIERFLLWWIEIPWCFGGICNDLFPYDGFPFSVIEFLLVLFFPNGNPPFSLVFTMVLILVLVFS
jgi:hypothetical protein